MSGTQDVLCFSAGISGDTVKLEEGTTLVFDKVLTNHGAGYNPQNGIFTSPSSGVYSITVEVSVEPDGKQNLELLVDDARVAEITIEAPKFKIDSISRNWILDLKKGIAVSVKAIDTGEVRGQMHTSFSGYRIAGAGTEEPTDSTDLSRFPELYANELNSKMKRYDILRDLDIFVLDNSMRESTVGQLKGHVPENKWKIFEEVKKCGFKHTIVASFAQETRVDDVFIKQISESGEDKSGLYGFSEITTSTKAGVPDTEKIPVGVRKLQEVGLYNVIFEIDLGDAVYDFSKFSLDQMCQLILKLITYCHNNLHEHSKVLFNFRDLPDVMPRYSRRLFHVIDFMAKLPPRLKMFGIMFEEPRGKSMPEECSMWAKYIRRVMDINNWKGNLLVHVHEKFGYCDVMPLEVLMNGANGIWASVCLEGSSMGNAASCITLMNLVRLGNKKVLKRYNCQYLRKAAINVTRITTGKDPDIKQPIYGARALDFVFDLNKEEFDLADFFGEKGPVRMTTLSSTEMIRTKLVNVFGEDDQFTLELAQQMKEKMLEDLRGDRKEEYMSKYGLAVLFDRAGGSLTEAMRDVLAKGELQKPHAKNLIEEVRTRWDQWDCEEDKLNDDMLEFDSFYNGFMAPYFACYRCSDTLKALNALDMDNDGYIDWNEFKIYLTWALYEYPDVPSCDELLDIVFQKGLIPAMRDEMLSKKEKRKFLRGGNDGGHDGYGPGGPGGHGFDGGYGYGGPGGPGGHGYDYYGY